MSRTYRNKIREGICVGSNTEWYRSRNRIQRHKNNNELRSKLANYNYSDLDDCLKFVNWPKQDSWYEPTDGTWIIDNDFIQHFYNKHINRSIFTNKYVCVLRFMDNVSFYKFIKKKCGRYLKPKQYDKNRKSRTIHMVINSLAC